MFSFDQLKYPLIQAPMAGGPNTPEMVSSVINAGAVGSYGFAYSNAETIESDIRAARSMLSSDHSGALNVNFFIFAPVEKPAPDVVDAALADLRDASIYDIDLIEPVPPYYPDLSTQLQPVWQLRPEILTFHFGIPDRAIIDRAHALDIAVGITATCVNEARQIEQAGADFIVAQGIEAGGHRGIFRASNPDAQLPCSALIESLAKQARIPLVGAGGIMNAEQVQNIRALGATAVQMGTAFLTTTDSGASKAHRNYLLNESERSAELTLGFSGRPARGIHNQFIERMKNKATLPFPLQNSLTAKMRAQALSQNEGEFQSLWAGANFRQCQAESITALLKRVFEHGT